MCIRDSVNIIAEDLGYITDSVRQLVNDSGFPNMKVLEFAFDSREMCIRDSDNIYIFGDLSETVVERYANGSYCAAPVSYTHLQEFWHCHDSFCYIQPKLLYLIDRHLWRDYTGQLC